MHPQYLHTEISHTYISSIDTQMITKVYFSIIICIEGGFDYVATFYRLIVKILYIHIQVYQEFYRYMDV